MAIDYIGDMRVLFDKIPLDKVTTSMTINAPATVLLAMYLAIADEQGIPYEKLGGTVQNDILKEITVRGQYIYPPAPSMKLTVDLIEYCFKNVPRWNSISISGYHIREAGSTAAQEAAFPIADGIAYVQACVERGLDVDKFAPRLSFFFNAFTNVVEEVAKFRAARRVWAKIMKERFGAKDPRSLMLRFHVQTGGVTLTAQQPLNNIIRSAYHALGAALSGTTAMQIPAYDEPIGIPTEESAILTLRIQQILVHETGVTKVGDPLAGSYYVEWLTKRMEEEGKKILKEIEDAGGFVKAHKEGMLARVLRKGCDQWREEIETNKRVVVGWNKYQTEESLKVKAFRPDPEVARISIERTREYKKNRDQAKTDAALNGVVEACKKLKAGEYGHVMPACIEAAKARATAGEISKALRKVMRWGPEYNVMLKF